MAVETGIVYMRVLPRLLVGDKHLCIPCNPPENIAICCASKLCHRRIVGYKGWAAPAGPEYLIAYRYNRIALNIVDGAEDFLPP